MLAYQNSVDPGGFPTPKATSARSAKACSEFIDANQGLMGGMGGGGGRSYQAGPGQAPSEKQILFAARLARERQLGLSAEALSDKMAMSQFIDACLKSEPAAAAPPALT